MYPWWTKETLFKTYIFFKSYQPQTSEHDLYIYIYMYIHTHTHTQYSIHRLQFSDSEVPASPPSLKSAQLLNTDNNIPSVFTVTVQAGQIIWYPIITDRYNVPHIMSSHTGICLAGVQLLYTHTHTHTQAALCIGSCSSWKSIQLWHKHLFL